MKYLLFILLLIASCYPHQAVHLRYTELGPMVFRDVPINWSFSCVFPQEDRQPVRDGFGYWNQIIGREIFHESKECGVVGLVMADLPRVLVVFTPGANPSKDEILATTDVGIFGGVPRSAIVRYYGTWADHKMPRSLESAARHEAGHVLGFGHSDYEWCLMYPTITMERYVRKAKTVCDAELQEARRLYGKE